MTDKPSHIASLAAAVLGVSAAWLFRWLLTPVVGERLPFIGTEGDALVAEELFCVAGAEERATGIMCCPRGE